LRSQPSVGASSAATERPATGPETTARRVAIDPPSSAPAALVRWKRQHHAGRVVEAAHVAGVERDLAVGLEAGERRAAELFAHPAHRAREIVTEDEVAADAVEDEGARDRGRL